MNGSEQQEWFNPLMTTRHAPFVWDDGVHRVVNSEISGAAICFTTACGHVFVMPMMGLPVSELRIGNPVVTCKGCLEKEDSE